MTGSSSASSPPADVNFQSDFADLGRALWRRLWLIMLVAAATSALGIAYVLRAKTIFESTVTVQVEQREQTPISFKGTGEETLQSELLKTIEQNFTNRQLMQRVVEHNKLAGNRLFLAADANADQLVDFLAGRTTARLRRGTRLIDISFDHESPSMARQIADSIVKESIALMVARKYEAAQSSAAYLVQEADSLKKKLLNSEKALQDYREKSGSAAVEDRQNTVGQKLNEISSALTQTKAARLRLEADLEQIEREKDDPDALLNIASIANQSNIASLRQAVTSLEVEIANASQRYTDKHPRMIQVKSQLEESKRALRTAVLQAPETLRRDLESAAARERSFEKAQKEQEVEALEFGRQSIQYNALAREVETNRAMYQLVLERFRQNEVTLGMEPISYRVIENASPPIIVRPQRSKIVAIAFLAGLVLGIAAAVGLHALDRTIKTVDKAEAILQMPVLTAVQKSKTPVKNGGSLEMLQKPDSPVAESFRTLRTTLLLLGPARTRKSFAITSAIPGEGKTYTSTHLAVSFAQQGIRTLLIDADLRRPSIEKLLFATSDAPGMTEYLSEQVKLEDVIRPTSVEYLSSITAGGRAPNPAELLGQDRFREMMETLGEKYDRIVLDTAPINAVSDTLMIAPTVQTVCIVVNSLKTPRNAVLRALEQLRRVNAPVAGIILNRLPSSGTGYYYHYAGNKTYGREGVYGAAR